MFDLICIFTQSKGDLKTRESSCIEGVNCNQKKNNITLVEYYVPVFQFSPTHRQNWSENINIVAMNLVSLESAVTQWQSKKTTY